MLGKNPNAITDQVGCCFESGNDQEEDHGNDFIFRQIVTIFFRMNKPGQNIVTWIISLLLNQFANKTNPLSEVPEQGPGNPPTVESFRQRPDTFCKNRNCLLIDPHHLCNGTHWNGL